MKTRGDVEGAICDEFRKFEREHMGRTPKTIECFLVRDLLVLRLKDILTPAEQDLVKTARAQAGRDWVRQMRDELISTSLPMLTEIVNRVTGVKVLNLHHDISTLTGEEVFLFSLDAVPDVSG